MVMAISRQLELADADALRPARPARREVFLEARREGGDFADGETRGGHYRSGLRCVCGS